MEYTRQQPCLIVYLPFAMQEGVNFLNSADAHEGEVMKKILALIIVSLITVFSVACNNAEAKEYSFYVPEGATALAVAKLISDGDNFGTGADMNYSVVSSGDIGSAVLTGKDFVVLPVNAATKLYDSNKNDPYKMLGVLTHGNLFLAGKETLTVSSIKGKTVGVIGQGLVPDLTFRAVLKSFNLDYEISDSRIPDKIAVKYFPSASDLMPMLKQGKIDLGLLPEPALSKLQNTVAPDYKFSLSIQELYDGENKSYPQAVIMVKSSVIEENKGLTDKLAESLRKSIRWLKENKETAVESVNSALSDGVVASFNKENLTDSVIENCNIYFGKASEEKQAVLMYIDRISNVEPNAVKKVGDDFFINE